MPELPEVETTRRGIAPYCLQQTITDIVIRNRNLRWPVASSLPSRLRQQRIIDVQRRAKYLLLHTDNGTLILHLGMSGSLRICNQDDPVQKHDHVDIVLSEGTRIRFNDPRRFGSLHWTAQAIEKHKLLSSLGPEPLGDEFTGNYLYHLSRGRKVAIKNLIMNSHVVVGVGNIYASESLFLAGIHPRRNASRISLPRYERLANSIRDVLRAAIDSGGSTLNDFTRPDGQPGYFQHHFSVYGKAGEPCEYCQQPISQITLGQRSTFYCKSCQH
jgi:formamidopyrimidine-DNA glycosylase